METRYGNCSGNGEKTAVSLDLDDVLVDIMDLYLKELRLITGLSFTREDVAHYDTTRLTTTEGISPTPEQVNRLIDSLAERGIYAAAPPFEDGLVMCHQLVEQGFSLVINTARRASCPSLQQRIIEDTNHWLKRYFPSDYFLDVAFANCYPGGKLQVCQDFDCIAHVEDAWHHVEEIMGQPGLLPVLLETPHNRYAWNRTIECPPADQLNRLETVFAADNPGFPIVRVHSHGQVPGLISWLRTQKYGKTCPEKKIASG